MAKNTSKEVDNFLANLSRYEIAKKSIDERGVIIVASNMEESIELMNEIAPEHLEVIR